MCGVSAVMVVWCLCSAEWGQRGLAEERGGCEGMREGGKMVLTWVSCWPDHLVDDLLSCWFVSRWSPSSHVLSCVCNGTS